ncbi:MAG: nicotinate-nucleotide--dimethylbenzimidazole phosphoribosyltransferase [Magnetococcales bacterium]|nr:nicotinate-nucleotide--dimethylbenzimidazole phosphoribosyltransferase [Magnetococcales bacterium]HIJ82811.1 nicotinate-nucleotide--dimethylbenzimidazole phosphoribosyltransferase [Magnetococcales bacterium]
MRPDWINHPVPPVSSPHMQRALERQNQLTKPPGSLGMLEELAVRSAGWLASDRPSFDRMRIVVFAGDHGIAAAGVSAFPQAVTLEMVRNFSNGGAAICVLAQETGAQLEVVDAGVVTDCGPLPGVVSGRAAAGTADFRHAAAMTHSQFNAALELGRQAVRRGVEAGVQLLIGGEMGIGNTTAASAVGSVLTGMTPEAMTGPGTGVDGEGMARKAKVIAEAVVFHGPSRDDPLEVMRLLGGLEMAALTGFYLAAAQAGVVCVVDGFITAAAALTALRVQPAIQPWLLFSHMSKEPGHAALLQAANVAPVLSLGMRLGEASGGATLLPILKVACALHNRMATFQEASVSGKK